MEVSAANSQIAKLCGWDSAYRVKRLGMTVARKLEMRLVQFDAADNMASLSAIPGARPHPLSGDRSGEFAVTVHGGIRIVFAPWHDPLPQTADGGLDLSSVTAICITEIGDYHRG